MADKQKRKRNKKTPAGLRKRIVKVGDTKRVRWYGRVKKSNGMWTEIRLKGCTTEEEAKGQLTEIRELTIDGLMVMDQEQAGCSESYRYEKPFSKEHKRIIKLHLRPYFENQSLADASLFRLKNHLESQSKPIAAATIKKILLVARRLMRAGCLNPEMPSIKINNERKYEMRYDHLEKMLAVTKNKDLQDMVLFIAYTGCRRGELAKVKWNDVDFKGLTVTFKETKNGKDHCIPMSNDLVMLLKRRKKGLHT